MLKLCPGFCFSLKWLKDLMFFVLNVLSFHEWQLWETFWMFISWMLYVVSSYGPVHLHTLTNEHVWKWQVRHLCNKERVKDDSLLSQAVAIATEREGRWSLWCDKWCVISHFSTRLFVSSHAVTGPQCWRKHKGSIYSPTVSSHKEDPSVKRLGTTSCHWPGSCFLSWTDLKHRFTNQHINHHVQGTSAIRYEGRPEGRDSGNVLASSPVLQMLKQMKGKDLHCHWN